MGVAGQALAPAAVILLSGGLDSATTLAIAINQGFRAHALSVLYGQRHRIEIDQAAKIARALGVTEHRRVELDLGFVGGSALTDPTIAVPHAAPDEPIGGAIPVTYVPARNTLFLALGLAWAESLGARDLFIGVNALDYSGYPDCRRAFLEAFERLAALGTKAGVEGHSFRIHAPLLEMSKAEIVRKAAALGVDPGLTFSCYDPGEDGRPCGRCESCVLRARGFREAGLDDPALED
jgi:7-cyano-7-deazaguanine synthase